MFSLLKMSIYNHNRMDLITDRLIKELFNDCFALFFITKTLINVSVLGKKEDVTTDN